MKILDPAHVYETDDGQLIQFIKRQNGELIRKGTTNEELIEILIDRLTGLNHRIPCYENEIALVNLKYALHSLYERTYKREMQGVETKDLPNVS